MIFKEYRNPDGQDYDIKVSVDRNYGVLPENIYSEMLAGLIGVLEDISEDELISNYGITLAEYLNPNEEVVSKVKYYLESQTIKRK